MTSERRVSRADSCPFCRILAEPDQSVVLRSDTVLAFLDHRPLSHGHVPAVPRRHMLAFSDLESDLPSTLFSTVRQISEAVERVKQAEGIFIAVNS